MFVAVLRNSTTTVAPVKDRVIKPSCGIPNPQGEKLAATIPALDTLFFLVEISKDGSFSDQFGEAAHRALGLLRSPSS